MSIFYEMDKDFGDLLKEKKNFLFIGEAGSGKSEIVLNVAAKLAEQIGAKVQVFDMDQSKPLYRSRRYEGCIRPEGCGDKLSVAISRCTDCSRWCC